MVATSELGDTPSASFHSFLHGGSTNLNEKNTIRHKDELHTSGYKSARLPKASRSLLAAFVAVSAVIFLVYICTLSIGKRLTAPSSGRRLAARSDGRACKESEDSSSIDLHADTSAEGDPAVLTPLAPAVQDLHTQQGNAGPTSQTETTMLPSGKRGLEAGSLQLETQRTQTSHKRKGEEQSKVGTEAKQPRLEPDNEETQVQSTLPPLDPELDSFIDFVLLRGGYAFSEAFWLSDADPLHSTADPSTDSELRPSGGGSKMLHKDTGSLGIAYQLPLQPSELKERKKEGGAKPPLSADSPDSRTQHRWPVNAGTLHTAPVPHAAKLETQRTQTSHKRKGEEQSKVGTEAKQPRLEPDNEETQVQSPLPPLDPELDSLIDLVLSEVDDVFAEGVWLGYADPLHSTADPSTDSKRPVSGRGSELPRKDIGALGIAYQLPAQPSKRKERKKEGTAKPPLSADSPGIQMQRRSPVKTGALHTKPVPDGARSPPLTQLPTDANVIAHFGWLGDVYPGVPDSVLKMHPFYRYPKTQPAPSTRPFDVELAEALMLSNFRIHPSKALAVCREIMGKQDLSSQDFEQLLFHAERLCGYAMVTMPVGCARQTAKRAIDTLGVIFLVLDTLHCAAEILGQLSMKHVWWTKILRHIETATYTARMHYLVPGKRSTNAEIARTLGAALEYYRKGRRPPVRMVVGLKEALLCKPGDSSKFKDKRWRPWREDAAQWRQSIVPSLTGSE
ncbi:hypothetical protein EBH_0083770 [Eimeria brunetti]|uniref:Transmembrane protein n=1 Tax=Eimeria brunetti TaxID=51314 RepID=U6LHB7_9EIME|nr:hypothetical protein EBH_0083770 [Eimeria brunetti]